eukprot:jgi/Mesvir1/15559/Mv03192-RA.1
MGEPQLQIGEPTWRALASCAAQLTEDDFRRLAGSALDELLGGAPSSAADHAGATADAMGGPSMEADGRAAVTVVACDAARLDLSGAALREALLSQLRGNVCEGSQAEGSHNRGEGDGARASDHSSARAGAAHIKGTHPGKGGANEGGTAGPHVRTSHATALTEEYATALAEEYVSRKAAIREGQLAGYSLHAPWPRLAGVSWRLDLRAKSSESIGATCQVGAPGTSRDHPQPAFAMKQPTGPEPIFHIRLLTKGGPANALEGDLTTSKGRVGLGGVPAGHISPSSVAGHIGPPLVLPPGGVGLAGGAFSDNGRMAAMRGVCPAGGQDDAVTFACTEDGLRDLVNALRDACKAPERHLSTTK